MHSTLAPRVAACPHIEASRYDCSARAPAAPLRPESPGFLETKLLLCEKLRGPWSDHGDPVGATVASTLALVPTTIFEGRRIRCATFSHSSEDCALSSKLSGTVLKFGYLRHAPRRTRRIPAPLAESCPGGRLLPKYYR